jgi:hypothetical protein
MKGTPVEISTRLALDVWLNAADELLAEQVVDQHDEHNEDEPPMLIGKLWTRFSKERDLELHIRVGWLFGTEFVQILDYVPSTGRYETDVMIERRLLDRLMSELMALYRYSGPGGVR